MENIQDKIKNKIFDKKILISFILGLVIMFGAGYAYLYYIKNNNCLFSNIGTIEIFGEIEDEHDKEEMIEKQVSENDFTKYVYGGTS